MALGLPVPPAGRSLSSRSPSVASTGRQDNLSSNHQRRRAMAARSAASAGSDGSGDASPKASPARRVSVPDSVDESVQQARAAVRRAREAGHRRLQLDLLLPLIGPSILDDWPGGIQQQLQAALPLVESLLKGLVDGGEMYTRRVIDQEDAVVVWESKTVALVLFPTAETLSAVQELAGKDPNRTVIMVNPQWQPGQVVSDFGFGRRRKEAEEFLGSFLTAYSLRRTRIRSAEVTVVKCFPGQWQVYASDDSGSGSDSSSSNTRVIGESEARPAYREIEAMLVQQEKKEGGGGAGGFFGRMAKEIEFLKRSK
eukprot:TRINITY_DN46507_c0_g1_i1.p1 TRINITY_DN46507_c0_g1~~TRINITY_DN46507_c0_g1_i1.p1  ORF type:complete len:359 (+),score=6.22 TRINITY_DN46507_c0_g1_i1:142-1077(+)